MILHYLLKLINEDSDASYCYYCLHKFHWKPTDFIEMDRKEKAFVIAAIQIKSEDEKKKEKKMKKPSKKGR